MSSRLRLLSGTALAALTALVIVAGAPSYLQPANAQDGQQASVEAAGAPAGSAPITPANMPEPVDSSGAGVGTGDGMAASHDGHSASDAVAPATPTVAMDPPAGPASAQPTVNANVTPPEPASPSPAAASGAQSPPASSVPAAAIAAVAAPSSIALQLSARLEGKGLDSLGGTKPERDAISAFYAARGGEPLFTSGHDLSPVGRTAAGVFAASANDGLSPADYVVALPKSEATDAEIAELELRMAAATLAYARHLQSGRFDPGRISSNITPSPTVPDAGAVLALAGSTPDLRAALAGFAPQYPGYVALKAKLAALRPEQGAVTPPQVPGGKVMRPGMKDPRVPVLRTRLGLPAKDLSAGDDLTYDHDLVEAVKNFQAKVGQPPSGIVGAATLTAMNDTGERRIADIVANMERWRWLPHDVAPSYVIVNIPEFMVRIIKDGEKFHETRVVVGKPENQTPLLTHDMEYIVFNPAWNVPPGIARKEMLPKLAYDPYALSRQGIDVVRNGRVVDPGSIDWSRGTQGYSFRQPPGERNALGRIKFMFPNKHSVYLHDTPSRSLFAHDRRAYSHGCVRVFEPLKFGEAIFALGMPEDPWTQKRISSQLGGKERYVNLKQRFPVHLTYFSTYVNEAGQLVTREDLYGINAQTKLLLGLDGARRVADRRTNPAR